MAAVCVSSAAGALSLLHEADPRLQIAALNQLVDVVDQFWSEVLEYVQVIEALAEDDRFSARELAAFVASKCFFHVEEYDQALRLALVAGSHFDAREQSEYVETMLSKAILMYIAQRVQQSTGSSLVIDPKLETVVSQMFERCFADGKFEHAAGIAFEALRLDMIEAAIVRAPDTAAMLAYSFEVAWAYTANRAFRQDVVRVLIKLYLQQPEPNFSALCHCMQFLGDARGVAGQLTFLVQRGDQRSYLTAQQIAFDIVDNNDQGFQLEVARLLPTRPEKTDKGSSADGASANAEPIVTDAEELAWSRFDSLREIISGSVTVKLHVDFLSRRCQTDDQLLWDLKKASEERRDSILHHAAIVAHGYMQCGTTQDNFLSQNLEWMRRANNWARFSAVAGQGVVHKGHVTEAMTVLEPYLPRDGTTVNAHLNGGALYALGLIHAGKKDDAALEFLTKALRDIEDPVVKHGACLGLGLAALGTAQEGLFTNLKSVLLRDNAIDGEAAGVAIGLLLAGAGTGWTCDGEPVVQELLNYAAETAHEKSARSTALALALMCYGQEEAALPMVEDMYKGRDVPLRHGAMYALGLAYAGTGNVNVAGMLLHYAVSDVADNVRRAAVTNLGLVMFNKPELVPRLVSLLAESYNPHVRYGACMAVGIACAGTGLKAALELLFPLMDDPIDYVRQSAFLSLAMVLQQHTEARSPRVKQFREKLSTVLSDKHQTIMTKMGVVLAHGILDAGGRNCIISLRSAAGFNRMTSIVGIALWLQHWYWYPNMHFLSLALQPSALLCLNQDLKVPQDVAVTCNIRKAVFDYPPHVQRSQTQKKEVVKTVELSTTAKARAKAKAKEKEKAAADGGDVEMKDASETTDAAAATATSADGAAAVTSPAAETSKEPEPTSYQLNVPCRLLPAQVKFVSFSSTGRYVPVRPVKAPGVVMLVNQRPGEEEAVSDIVVPPPHPEEVEPEPPAPFEWTPN